MTDESPSLPPELLQDIIESSIARTYHSTSYDDRQATLRSLSLVSRQFRDIAQPLLGEIIDIRTESQLARLTAIGNKAFRPKELVLNHELRVETVEGLVKGAKGLGSLVIMRSAVHRNPMDLRALVERSGVTSTSTVPLRAHSRLFNP
ncbi:uncharacterized protein JCM6883_002890 [Sporobolomyces salmoneus]|uniref:uncharacterized protein n=1 Tax=Sporobolomyces salmoneus TaxID=183962 RepID=UPI00317FA0B2